MRIYFLRHGETNWNKEGKMQGNSDIPLNETGILQAEGASEFISKKDFSAVFVSPLKRAHHTAKIVLKEKAHRIVLDERLKERSYGEFEGKTFEEYVKVSKDDPYFTPQGGESRIEFGKRINHFFETLDAKHQNILVIAHGGVFNAILRSLFNLSLEEVRKHRLGNCEYCVIEKTKNEVRLIRNEKILLTKTQ